MLLLAMVETMSDIPAVSQRFEDEAAPTVYNVSDCIKPSSQTKPNGGLGPV
jgi:hypothetical protein